jgi:hypothetical protein
MVRTIRTTGILLTLGVALPAVRQVLGLGGLAARELE